MDKYLEYERSLLDNSKLITKTKQVGTNMSYDDINVFYDLRFN